MRLQDRALCASITSITGTYAEPDGQVIFAHRRNADERMVPRQLDLSSIVGKLMLRSASSASNPSGPCAAGGRAWAGWVCHGHGLQALDYLRNGRDHGEVCRRNSPRARGA